MIVAGAAACASLTVKPEFTPIGVMGGGGTPAPIVKAAGDVQVYYASSPLGFSLRDNELTIEDGYSHRIVGIVRVRYRGGRPGNCDAVQADAVVALQQGAYDNGANAVVYASTSLAREADERACVKALEAAEFGAGWAVILGSRDEPAAEGSE